MNYINNQILGHPNFLREQTSLSGMGAAMGNKRKDNEYSSNYQSGTNYGKKPGGYNTFDTTSSSGHQTSQSTWDDISNSQEWGDGEVENFNPYDPTTWPDLHDPVQWELFIAWQMHLQEIGFIGQMQDVNSMTGLGGGLKMNTKEQMSELWQLQFEMIQEWLDDNFPEPPGQGSCFGGEDADGNCLDDFLIPPDPIIDPAIG